MSEQLSIWLSGIRIGTLLPARNGARFQYTDAVAHSSGGLPLLSAALPVQAGPFDAERTRSWFTGLLPEDRQRDEVARRFNIQRGTYLDMLREIGWECAGAVVIARAERKPQIGSLQPLTADQLAERLIALPARPYDGDDAIRVSLGGYQAKLLVTQTDAGWALPIGGAVSTHILKPETRQWPNLAESEAWAMTAASAATPTAAVDILRPGGAPPTLVVQRFDRIHHRGDLIRTHQEDAAQAMCVPPERKYASRTASAADPSLARIAGVLERYSSDPRGARRQLLEQVVVNTVVGNTDAHAKNYGVLHPTAQTVALSPMYDVAPTVIVNPGTLDMGLRVGDSLRIDRVTVSKLEHEADSWGMGNSATRAVISATLDSLREGITTANERFPATPESVIRYAEDRIRALEQELTRSGD